MTNLCKYSVQVKAINSDAFREVIKVYTKELAERCVKDYSKDVPNAQWKIVELF
jgi:hypothetical protein